LNVHLRLPTVVAVIWPTSSWSISQTMPLAVCSEIRSMTAETERPSFSAV
jgi:hypothetical protein